MFAWSSGDLGPVDAIDEPDDARLWNLGSWKFRGSALRYAPPISDQTPPAKGFCCAIMNCEVEGSGVGLDL